MGIVKTIGNELFGTNKKCEVKGLGIFTGKFCNWWRNEDVTWGGTVRLPLYPQETFVLMDGDTTAPFPQQVQDLQALLHDWNIVIARLDSMLPNEIRFAHKEEIYASWHDTFYPENISPVVHGDGWEIAFARTDELKDYFVFNWHNGTVRELNLGVSA